ncbi:Peptidylprolyl isomerase domain and WD repeat containing protein 1, variant 3 [Balamuthia mandrillaris]
MEAGGPKRKRLVEEDEENNDAPVGPPAPASLKKKNKNKKRDDDEEKSGSEEEEGGGPSVGPPAPPAFKRSKTAKDSEEEEEEAHRQSQQQKNIAKKKKQKTLKYEKLYLERLPSAEMYEISYMHRDVVTHTAVSPKDFFITASKDGHLKFWKKKPEGIEFVKHFRAHLGPITCMAVSQDGSLLCTISKDRTLKIFDVVSFDMINMLNLDYEPSVCEWILHKNTGKDLVACGDREHNLIRIYTVDPALENNIPKPLHTIDVHNRPVILLRYNPVYDVAVSIDESGMIEYWSGSNFEFPSNIHFQYKTDTDLYEFLKKKTLPTSLAFSPDGRLFATMGKDRHVRLFNFLTGRLHRTYEESLTVFNELQKEENSVYKLDPIDFGRRMAVERAIDTEDVPPSNVVFDESSNFVLYPTMLGIKVVNIVTNKMVRIVGRSENTERFLAISLWQGKTQGSVEMGDAPREANYDPTIICAAYKKQRFYLFTRREPVEPSEYELFVPSSFFHLFSFFCLLFL